jgi:hypothetical protein
MGPSLLSPHHALRYGHSNDIFAEEDETFCQAKLLSEILKYNLCYLNQINTHYHLI